MCRGKRALRRLRTRVQSRRTRSCRQRLGWVHSIGQPVKPYMEPIKRPAAFRYHLPFICYLLSEDHAPCSAALALFAYGPLSAVLTPMLFFPYPFTALPPKLSSIFRLLPHPMDLASLGFAPALCPRSLRLLPDPMLPGSSLLPAPASGLILLHRPQPHPDALAPTKPNKHTLITPSSLPAVTNLPLTASSCVLRLPIVLKFVKLRCRIYGPGGGRSSGLQFSQCSSSIIVCSSLSTPINKESCDGMGGETCRSIGSMTDRAEGEVDRARKMGSPMRSNSVSAPS